MGGTSTPKGWKREPRPPSGPPIGRTVPKYLVKETHPAACTKESPRSADGGRDRCRGQTQAASHRCDVLRRPVRLVSQVPVDDDLAFQRADWNVAGDAAYTPYHLKDNLFSAPV
ncbi:hypothetical protein TWF696_005858 [Orbilia brochopaga]|uniref:Uncharacterized protein n=1 Tax=Orbilia brochopaga TaxID=3140254 RepID=A0AAV9UVQ8_9PEZI